MTFIQYNGNIGLLQRILAEAEITTDGGYNPRVQLDAIELAVKLGFDYASMMFSTPDATTEDIQTISDEDVRFKEGKFMIPQRGVSKPALDLELYPHSFSIRYCDPETEEFNNTLISLLTTNQGIPSCFKVCQGEHEGNSASLEFAEAYKKIHPKIRMYHFSNPKQSGLGMITYEECIEIKGDENDTN